MTARPPRTVLAIHSMVARTGGQLFVADMARRLAEDGRAVAVLAPDRPGQGVGAELVAAGVPVVGALGSLDWEPEVVWGHTTGEATAAALERPQVPAAFHCHGIAGPSVRPPRLRSIRRYSCTGSTTASYLRDAGVPDDRIVVVPNGVDLRRFPLRSRPGPRRPRRAAVFGTSFLPSDVEPIARACERAGIELDLIGGGLGAEVADPERALTACDVVFASGRAALEAASLGCAVVIWHPTGTGGLLTTANEHWAVGLNVGSSTYRWPPDERRAADALAAYDPDDAYDVARLVREERDLDRIVETARRFLDGTIATPPGEDEPGERRWLAGWVADQSQIVLAQSTEIWTLNRLLERAEAGRADPEEQRMSVHHDQALRDEVLGRPWFHTIDLGDGLVTPGIDDSAAKLLELRLPEDLAGQSVLDIGTYDGFFAFEAERRGAERVVAADRYCWSLVDMGDGRGFDLAHRALGSRVEKRVLAVEELDAEELGTFDLVLFLGVLYHAPDPLGYLRRARSLCRRRLVLETLVDGEDYDRPMMVFYPGDTLNGDASNMFGPNSACVEAMLLEAGFDGVERIGLYNGNRLVVHATVGSG